jgi:hypothetical protein
MNKTHRRCRPETRQARRETHGLVVPNKGRLTQPDAFLAATLRDASVFAHCGVMPDSWASSTIRPAFLALRENVQRRHRVLFVGRA